MTVVCKKPLIEITSPDEQHDRFDKGAELREIKSSSNIAGSVAQADKGEVVVSQIDCTQGAVAVITDELDGGVISKEFFLINLDKSKFRTQLFIRILLHKRYVQYLLSFRTGATNRLRLDKDILLGLSLPNLPTEQQDIILDELRLAEEQLSHVESIEANAHKLAEGLVGEALENVLNLGDEAHLLSLGNSAEIIKEKILKQVKEALQ